jgi:hypothetical protein
MLIFLYLNTVVLYYAIFFFNYFATANLVVALGSIKLLYFLIPTVFGEVI